MELDPIFAAAASSLRKILKCIAVDPAKQPSQFFAKLHAERIVGLADELGFVTVNSGKLSPPIIARAILESLFKLGVAASTQPDAQTMALEKAVQEIEWDAIQEHFPSAQGKELKSIRKKPDYQTKVLPEIAGLRSQWGLPTVSTYENLLSTWWCADKADMTDSYNFEYRLLSKACHASVTDFLSSSVELSIGVGVRCMIRASKCLTGLFPSQVHSTLVDEVDCLRQTINSKQWKNRFFARFVTETMAGLRGAPVNHNRRASFN